MLEPVDPRDVIYAKTRLILLSIDKSSRRPPHRKKCTCTAPTASMTAIVAQVEPLLGAPVSSRTIRRHMAEGHLGSQRPLRGLPLTLTVRLLCLEWCRARGNWIIAGWNQVVFSDDSRFDLSGDDNRARVWRPRGERFNPAFALQ
ncbi:transposable element Tcb2 transposase [Trichonephila clavipes]|nr:transposable element Tcb2 transposase [Trichonephila clavipes]